MKRITYFFLFLALFFYTNLQSQENLTVEGKTVTDTLQIVKGAMTGYLLESVDATGLGKWIDPATITTAPADWNAMINIPSGFADNIDDVDDADNDNSNELNTGIGLSGTMLSIIDAGGASTVDLAPLQDNLGNHTATMNLEMSSQDVQNLTRLRFVNGGTLQDQPGGGPGGTGGIMSLTNIDMTGNELKNAILLSFAPSGGATILTEVAGMVSPTEVQLIDMGGGGPLAGTPLGIGGPVNPAPVAMGTPSVLGNAGGPAPVPIGFMFGVQGDAWAFNWWAVSDMRYKKNIVSATDGLDMVNKLNPVRYEMKTEEYKNMNFSEKPTFGFLAQELETSIPEAVAMRSDGKYLVNYSAIIPVLTQSIQELDAKVNQQIANDLVAENQALKKQLNDLQSENEAILERLTKLETTLSKK